MKARMRFIYQFSFKR